MNPLLDAPSIRAIRFATSAGNREGGQPAEANRRPERVSPLFPGLMPLAEARDQNGEVRGQDTRCGEDPRRRIAGRDLPLMSWSSRSQFRGGRSAARSVRRSTVPPPRSLRRSLDTLGLAMMELQLSIVRMVAAKKLKTTGQKRWRRYFVGSCPRHGERGLSQLWVAIMLPETSVALDCGTSLDPGGERRHCVAPRSIRRSRQLVRDPAAEIDAVVRELGGQPHRS